MSDSPLVRTLIAALREAGGDDQAPAFEHDFAARAWQVGPDDYLALTDAIQRAVLAPRSSAPPTQTDVPARLGKLAPFAPWVDVLPSRWKLVEAMDAVLRAPSTDELCRALVRVFVDVLGYEGRGIDEHSRLGEQTTFTRLVWLAEHDGFHIVVAESRYAGRFTQNFDPVFRLRPHAIVFAFESDREVRVIARRTTGRGPQYPCRTLRGLGLFASLEDDLLTWCRRVALLQPQPRDDREALRSRAEQCVLSSPIAVGAAWESGVVDPAAIPGSGWHASSAQAADLFLQPDTVAGARLMVGLEFELRAVMPWRSRAGVVIHFRGYEVVAAPEPLDVCIVRRHDRVALLRLDLVHESAAEDLGVRRVPFSVEAVVHVPGDDGVYCVSGDAMHHVPGLVPRAAQPDDDDDDELEVDESDADVDSAEPESAPETIPDRPAASEAAGARPDNDDVYRGPNELTVLRLAVAKRLRTIGYVASQITPETIATPELARAWLSARYGDARGRLSLTGLGHLRRHLGRGVGPWRPIRFEGEGSLPAWACPEAAAALPPGWAVPVAAARLGPGGVLVVPRIGADGSTKLVAAPEDAFTINPRFHVGADGTASSSASWVCERWSHRAAAKVGELGERPGIARSVQVPLRIACVRGVESRFLLPSEKWPTVAVRRMWCVDLPVGRERSDAPVIRLVRGQRIGPGDVIATIDPSSWAPRARSERHDVATQAIEVLPRAVDVAVDEEEAAVASSDDGWVVRAPPGLAGHVARAGWTVTHDRLGSPVGRRMTVETWLPIRPVAIRLRDGRRLPIQDCAPSEMPYSLDDGMTLDGLLEDDASGVESPIVEGDWIDARTGELVEDMRAMDSIEFEYPEVAALPDPELPVRALDGMGIPRSSDDARITQGKLRWWRASDPGAAASVDEAAARPHGWHPTATSLYDLAVASHVRAPPIVPAEWGEPAERESVRTEHDPVRAARGYRNTRPADRVDPITGHPTQQRYAPWAWSCRCGALRGEVRSFERCRACGDRTEPRLRVDALPPVGAIGLGTLVVHPWRKPIVAALLGLRPDELDTVLGAHDGAALAEATQLALVEPERSLLTRLSRSDDAKERESLSCGFEALASIHRLQFEDLWLSELRLLPTRLLPDALPMGAADLLASPLTRHYRLIASAAGLVARATDAGETLLRTLTGVRLQRAIDDLFGDLDEPSTGTLAELWRRLWPTTVDGELEFAVPGLFRGCSVAELRNWQHVGVFGTPSTDRGEERIDLGILRDGDVVVLPAEAPTIGAAVSSAASEERDAWCWISGPALPGLAAICLGVDVVPEVRAELGTLLPGALEDSTDVGRVVLRELLRAVEPPRGRPSILRRLLAGTRVEALPGERDAAILVVRERLRGAFGVRDPGTELVEHALALVLTRFDKGPITEQRPTGWHALLGGEAPAPGHRRCVPRLGDAAWAAWPGFLLLTDPVRCAAEARWNDPMSAGHRAWLGLDAPPLPRAWWSEHEVEAVAAELTSSSAVPLAPEPAEPLVVPEATDPAAGLGDELDVGIRILSTSVNAWIAEHISRSTNG